MGLVLTRYINERIHIGEDIDVTVTGVKDGQVKLHFEAPKEIIILREEVRLRNLRNIEKDRTDGNI